MMFSTQHVFCVFILIPIPTQPYGLQLLYRLFLFCNKICSVSIFVILFFRSGYTFHISETVDKFMPQCYFCRRITIFRTVCFWIPHSICCWAQVYVYLDIGSR